MLDAEHVELPRFFAFHGRTEHAHFFPHKFEDEDEIRPAYILLWAIQAVLNEDVYLAKSFIKALKDSDDPEDKEEMAVWREWGKKQEEHLKNVIAEMEEIVEEERDEAGEED